MKYCGDSEEEVMVSRERVATLEEAELEVFELTEKLTERERETEELELNAWELQNSATLIVKGEFCSKSLFETARAY